MFGIVPLVRWQRGQAVVVWDSSPAWRLFGGLSMGSGPSNLPAGSTLRQQIAPPWPGSHHPDARPACSRPPRGPLSVQPFPILPLKAASSDPGAL